MTTQVALENWVFARNATAACPTWNVAFACAAPPNACGSHPATTRQYCCDQDNRICWGPSATCSSDGSTFTCGSGSSTWCCIRGSEICTQASGQINICWSTTDSILVNISRNTLERTYSSLSAASPAASSFSFSPQSLIAETATTSTSTRASQTTGTPGSATDTSPSGTSSTHGSSTTSANIEPVTSGGGLGGGAIAGIVVGVLAALVIGVAIGYFVVRSLAKKKEQAAAAAAAAAAPANGGPAAGPPPGVLYPPYGQYQQAELEQKYPNQPYSPYSSPSTLNRQELPAHRDSYVEMPTHPH